MTHSAARHSGFTLIELLIVVAIIAILAAIAVPNFLEAQTRSKVSRAKADIRTMTIGIESFYVDHNDYPEGTDNPNNYPERIQDFFTPYGLAAGFYSFRTRGGGLVAGQDFATLTTPVAYLTSVPTDPFARQAAGFLTYCYRNAKDTKNGYIITSFGPDADVLASEFKLGAGTMNTLNPLSTAVDGNTPARLGDVNERAVVHLMEGTAPALVAPVEVMGGMRAALAGLSYDPTNGTVSDGDIIYIGPGLGFINP